MNQKTGGVNRSRLFDYSYSVQQTFCSPVTGIVGLHRSDTTDLSFLPQQIATALPNKIIFLWSFFYLIIVAISELYRRYTVVLFKQLPKVTLV